MITGRSRQTIADLISGRSGVTPEMAVSLAAAFGNKPADWLRLDATFRLSQVGNAHDIERRARLFSIAPIRDIQKREWIKTATDLNELETELKSFFGLDSLNGELTFPVATRRRVNLPSLNVAERAWVFRARQLASALLVERPFSADRMESCEKRLRQLAAYPKEARHLPKVLAEYGIRFVVIEPLPSVRIDGATFWIDAEPVIAVSIRYDRIDGFWFTLMHELAHVRNGDALSVDTDMVDAAMGRTVTPEDDEVECRANEQAAALLIPRQEMESFVRRVGPRYSKERVIQFAHKVKIHPGIVVGQLHYRDEIGYSALRGLLAKVRNIVTGTALTDGWNKTIAPGLL